jgi:hypothetical protein
MLAHMALATLAQRSRPGHSGTVQPTLPWDLPPDTTAVPTVHQEDAAQCPGHPYMGCLPYQHHNGLDELHHQHRGLRAAGMEHSQSSSSAAPAPPSLSLCTPPTHSHHHQQPSLKSPPKTCTDVWPQEKEMQRASTDPLPQYSLEGSRHSACQHPTLSSKTPEGTRKSQRSQLISILPT